MSEPVVDQEALNNFRMPQAIQGQQVLYYRHGHVDRSAVEVA